MTHTFFEISMYFPTKVHLHAKHETIGIGNCEQLSLAMRTFEEPCDMRDTLLVWGMASITVFSLHMPKSIPYHGSS